VIFLTIFTKKKYQKTPHICDDFQSDPRESSSVDWVRDEEVGQVDSC